MAGLKYWDGTQWVLLPGGAGDFVKRIGDLMSGPLTITDDGSENPNALLLYVAGEMLAGTAMASAVIADTVVTGGVTIEDGAQPGFVWTATDDQGHGEWQPLTNITPGPASIIISDTAPANPPVGTQWWDTSIVEAEPFLVSIIGSGGASHTVSASGSYVDWPGAPKISLDIPCDGLLKVSLRGLMKAPTNAGVGYALGVAEQNDLVATTIITPEARVASTGTAEALAQGGGFYDLSGVGPSGGSVVFTQRELGTTGTTCTIRYPCCFFEFLPRGKYDQQTWTPT